MATTAHELNTLDPASPRYADNDSLVEKVDALRLALCNAADDSHRSNLGQFLTPAPVARFMASLFEPRGATSLRLLDAGAGIGTLSAAWVAAVCAWEQPPRDITVTAFEIDAALLEHLQDTLRQCARACEQAGIRFTTEVRQQDFIAAGTQMVRDGLFALGHERFDYAILNPPYHKIRSDSEARRLLHGVGVETSNLYTAFLSLAAQLLNPGGELVAITPRSFCNGPYFRPFRQRFLQAMSPRRFHTFDSRDQAFRDDSILQETLITYAVKDTQSPPVVLISSSTSPDDQNMRIRETTYDQVVHPNDPDAVIHLVLDGIDQRVGERMKQCRTSLSTLGLTVSTGRVVDFRARDYLRATADARTVPLIYPEHCGDGYVSWPKERSRKPQAIAIAIDTEELLIPEGIYVVVKRFSSKEERRRIVAAIYDPARLPTPRVGFENHLNYYHCHGQGLPANLAKGLAAFLNSSVVDAYFRQFSGHTQVNAADLRKLRYPSREILEAMGSRIGDAMPTQDELDQILDEEVFQVADDAGVLDPIQAKRRIAEALEVLKSLGLPREQQNERSALTLLALLNLQADMGWSEASNPLCGIIPMMEFFRDRYGKIYAPNTRETVRRFTIHQFMEAGLVIVNPDNPARPVNSPDTVYQIEPDALALLRRYGSEEWDSI